ELMRTRRVHAGSGEGRHMTSHRQLVRLPQGGAIIDTPGLREAQLWEGDEALAAVFEDIEALAAQCKFRDCRHESEPGCAVKDGVDAARLRSYRKLKRELRSIEVRSNALLRIEERKRWKRLITAARTRARP
ncbi:MAG TPA: GTPase RsgA, partial [Candidatus Dormibacteraeota bacterium]|nr:GTPase RsgA [Candidatus Dormibacteraeota bacterium]